MPPRVTVVNAPLPWRTAIMSHHDPITTRRSKPFTGFESVRAHANVDRKNISIHLAWSCLGPRSANRWKSESDDDQEPIRTRGRIAARIGPITDRRKASILRGGECDTTSGKRRDKRLPERMPETRTLRPRTTTPDQSIKIQGFIDRYATSRCMAEKLGYSDRVRGSELPSLDLLDRPTIG